MTAALLARPRPTVARAEPRTVTVRLPELHGGQVAIERSKARFKVIAAGRRWGKTRRSVRRVVAAAMQDPGGYFWAAPTFALTLEGWEQMQWLANQIPGTRTLAGQRKVILPGGGWVQAKSAKNPNSLRSRGLKGVVLEEAAFMDETAWTLALRPALADKRGWAEFISTPNGHNWFYELAERAGLARLDQERDLKTGQVVHAVGRGGWEFFHAPTSSNPFISPDELAEMREELGPFAYAQEIDAEFAAEGTHSFSPQQFRYFDITADGFVLTSTDDAGGKKQRLVPADEPWMVQAYDLAFSESVSADYFVCLTMLICRDGSRLILDVYRDHVAWSNQPQVIEDRYLNAPTLISERQPGATLKPALVGVEKEFHQMSVIQALRSRTGIPVRPMGTLGKQKPVRALRPAQLYQNQKIFHLRGAAWLPAFERELWDFPFGRHDDQVDALAYACELSESPAAGLLEWYRRNQDAASSEGDNA